MGSFDEFEIDISQKFIFLDVESDESMCTKTFDKFWNRFSQKFLVLDVERAMDEACTKTFNKFWKSSFAEIAWLGVESEGSVRQNVTRSYTNVECAPARFLSGKGRGSLR